MIVIQFIFSFCLVAIFVSFIVDFCAAVWSYLKDVITDWKQYQFKGQGYYYPSNASQSFQEHDELIDDSTQVLDDTLPVKGLLVAERAGLIENFMLYYKKLRAKV